MLYYGCLQDEGDEVMDAHAVEQAVMQAIRSYPGN
jgi:hypothetical protein